MRIKQLFSGLLLVGFASIAWADLEPWTDYDMSEGVSNVTTIKVDSNMIDKYLEGLKSSWVPANEVLMEQGRIKDYGIYVSDLPNGGDFNVILVVRFDSAADLQPAKENYDAFMKAWGEENQENSDKIVMTYPDIRTITGEYLFREITMK
jgi:hypothetical protein